MLNDEDWVKAFLSLNRKERKKVDVFKSGLARRKKYHRRKRRVYTKEEVINIVLTNNIKTQNQLCKAKYKNEDIPPQSAIVRLFGSWGNLKRTLYGSPIDPSRMSDMELIKIALRLNIKKLNQYRDVRRKEPNLIPSSLNIMRRFGCWRNFKRMIMAYMNESILERYILLRNQLGHFPTKKQCRQNNLEISRLFKHIPEQEVKLICKYLDGVKK